MNYSLLHLTYREMRDTFLKPRPLAILGLVSLVLGLSGPFQTFELLAPVQRVIYWTAICSLTFAAGQFAGSLAMQIARLQNWKTGQQVAVSGLASGLAVWPVVIGINWITFDGNTGDWLSVGSLLAYCILIATVIAAVSALMAKSTGTADEAGPVVPKIVSRLPLNLRGPLISLSVQDHYVEVVTAKGAGLVHFALRDAMDDCDGVDGLQIHRSHWVARAAIKSVFRRDGKVFVETIRGDALPVSRTYLPDVKARGLL